MEASTYLLSALLTVAIAALAFVVVRLLGRMGSLEDKLMAMTQPYPHQALLDLQRAQIELQRQSMMPQPVHANPFAEPEEST